MKRFIVLFVCIVALLFVSLPCGYAQEGTPRFEPSGCPIDIPSDPPIDCGYLIVPEDRGDPGSPSVRMPIIIIHSRSDNAAPDPIVFAMGGPGATSLWTVQVFADSPLVENRDLIIMEQRGAIYAEPNLDCEYAQLMDSGTPCLESLLDRGVDLTNYTMEAMVADLDALRNVLDHDEWNLFGESYSTRLMLLTMHAHPEGIRSVVLDSVSRPTKIGYEHWAHDFVRPLKVMLDDCAADPGCAAAYPHLETQLYALISRLNADPVTLDVYDHITCQPTAVVDGDRLLGWINRSFYDPANPAYPTGYLPLLIDQVARGNTDLLLPWVVEERTWDDLFTWGLYFAVSCQDEFAAADPDAVAAQSAAYPELGGWQRPAYELALCEAWDLPGTTPLATEPVVSDIPTLVLAGPYDPVTPPADGQAVATSLSNSYFYEFPAMGHWSTGYSPCAHSVIAAFLDDPSSAPDTRCIADMPSPEFVLPQDIRVAPGLYPVVFDIGKSSGLEDNLQMACLLVFLAEIGLLAIGGILQLVRHRERAMPRDGIARFAHPLAGLVAVLNVGLSVAVSAMVRTLADTNRLTLRFGVPAEYAPLFVIPVVAAILTLGLVITVVVVWVRGHRTVLERAFLSLVTLAAVVFVGLMVSWDLLTLPF
jgi:pimeloyl-ACP methyl ester carboxylesterase